MLKEQAASGPWKIEIWIPPVRHPITEQITRPGFWKIIGEMQTDSEAEAAVRFAGGETVPGAQRRLARARRDPVGDGLNGMVCAPTHFARWTGSGGRWERA